MIQGLYAAASGMLAVEARQDTIANNIANASTVGYRREAPVQLGFYQVFSEILRRPVHFNLEPAPAGGVKLVETFTNALEGILQTTDNPLHMALRGPGYFAVDTPNGERYTRAGDFTVDADGPLATRDGYKVASTTGTPIDARGGVMNVDREGRVRIDGVAAGQIRIIEFETPERLLREGDNLYRASEEVLQRSAVATGTTVEHKQLELSNTSLPLEMTQLMLGLRAYEANQRVIQAIDGTVERLINQVGMPA